MLSTLRYPLDSQMLSSFTLARSEKNDKKEGKKTEHVKKEKKWPKKSQKELRRAVLELKEQIQALSQEVKASTGDLQEQLDEISAGNQGGNDTGPRFMCPGCTFPPTKLPEDVLDRLPGAYLPGAWFMSTDLTDADLSGADVSGAWFMSTIWSNTTCPDGTNSDDNGDTCEGHY